MRSTDSSAVRLPSRPDGSIIYRDPHQPNVPLHLYYGDLADSPSLINSRNRIKPDEVHNLGVGREITIRELVELIVRLTGFEGELRWDAAKPDGQPRRALDTSRAKQGFGFEARTSFEDGLRRTIERYADAQ